MRGSHNRGSLGSDWSRCWLPDISLYLDPIRPARFRVAKSPSHDGSPDVKEMLRSDIVRSTPRAWVMASEVPVVRHFVACQEVVVQPGSRNATLRDLIHAIIRLPGEPSPCICAEMALYAVLANGRGEHDFAIEMAFLDQAVERSLYRSSPRHVDLGQDPTTVHGLPIRMRNVIFDQAGQYTFYLLSDGRRIAQEQVDVR
jgi:hypothetical protein